MAPSEAYIRAFRHGTGYHCASSAFRDVVAFETGLQLSEAMVFGLSEALQFMFVDFGERFVFMSWSFAFDQALVRNLGLDVVVTAEQPNDVAWAAVRDKVAEGRVVIVNGDAKYPLGLSYSSPMHTLPLVGYDERAGHALVIERRIPDPVMLPLPLLATMRNPPETPPPGTANRWWYFRSPAVSHDLRQAGLRALRNTARNMLSGEPEADWQRAACDAEIMHLGLPGVAVFHKALMQWREQLDQAALRERFVVMNRIVFKVGADGGFFRVSLTNFITEMAGLAGPWPLRPRWIQLARQSAELWASLGTAFGQLAQVATSSVAVAVADAAAAASASASTATAADAPPSDPSHQATGPCCDDGEGVCAAPPPPPPPRRAASAEEAALWRFCDDTLRTIYRTELDLFSDIDATLSFLPRL